MARQPFKLSPPTAEISQRNKLVESNARDRRTARESWLRLGLLLLTIAPTVVGTWALFIPRSFYEDFPASGRHWVSSLPPYNELLVRDIGALNLAFGVLLAAAAILLGQRLIQASLVAWLIYAVPHFMFHLTELGVLSFGDALGNSVTLGIAVAISLILFILAGSVGANGAPSGSRRPAGSPLRSTFRSR